LYIHKYREKFDKKPENEYGGIGLPIVSIILSSSSEKGYLPSAASFQNASNT